LLAAARTGGGVRAPAPPSACQLWRFGGVAAGRGTRGVKGPPPSHWGGGRDRDAPRGRQIRRQRATGGGSGRWWRIPPWTCRLWRAFGGCCPPCRVAPARRTVGATATARDSSPPRLDGQSRRPLPGGKRREVGRRLVRPITGWSTRTGARGKSRMLLCPPQAVARSSLTFGNRRPTARLLIAFPSTSYRKWRLDSLVWAVTSTQFSSTCPMRLNEPLGNTDRIAPSWWKHRAVATTSRAAQGEGGGRRRCCRALAVAATSNGQPHKRRCIHNMRARGDAKACRGLHAASRVKGAGGQPSRRADIEAGAHPPPTPARPPRRCHRQQTARRPRPSAAAQTAGDDRGRRVGGHARRHEGAAANAAAERGAAETAGHTADRTWQAAGPRRRRQRRRWGWRPRGRATGSATTAVPVPPAGAWAGGPPAAASR